MKENIQAIACQFCGESFPVPLKQVEMNEVESLIEKLKYAHLCPWALDALSAVPRIAEIQKLIDPEQPELLANYLLHLERQVEKVSRALRESE